MFKALNVKTCAVLLLAGLLSWGTANAETSAAESAAAAQAQQATGTCTGTVVDSEGEPLIGASVRVEGTSIGTSADIDGNFTISDVKRGAKLVISYVGYKPQTVVWNGQPLNIVLSEDSDVLDEVVVMGYGITQKRAKVTNSVAKVSGETLTVGANANPAQALAGAVSGVKVNITTGDPSATPDITIRGGTNWSGSSNPLIVVDGQIRSSLSDINTNDIADMQILKDAGATALYGARAANGVVLITTKQGQQGKATINFSGKFGLNYYNAGYEFVGAREYIQYIRPGINNTEWAQARGGLGGLSANNQPHGVGRTQLDAGTMWNIMTMTDENKYLLGMGWESMIDPIDPNRTIIFKSEKMQDVNINKPAYTQDYNVSISGGNDRAKYYASLGYYNADGAFVQSFYKRYNFAFTGSYKITNWLESNSTFNFIRANWLKTPPTANAEPEYIFGRMMSVPATLRLTDEEGKPAFGQSLQNGNYNYQPDQFHRDNESNKFQMSTNLVANLFDGFTLKGSMSWYYHYEPAFAYNQEYQTSPGAAVGSSSGWDKNYSQSASFLRYFDQTYSLVANYNKTFKEKHTISATLGWEFYHRNYKAFSASGNKLPSGDWFNLGNTFAGTQNPYQPSSRSISSSLAEEKILSYLGRVEYDYMDKYLLAATFRSDGYSRLINNRWGFFPGVSAGWVMSQEDFWSQNEKLSFINYAKLRASFGLNGVVNGNVIDYYTLQGLYGAFNYNGNYGYRISTLPNQDLRWERTRTFDAGLTLAFLQNRFNLDVTYYNRLTMDKYASYALPPTTGFSSVTNNNGKFRNQGVEIDINGTLVRTKDFQWTLGANITYNKNIVVELPENEFPKFNYQQGATMVYDGNKMEDGKPVYTYIGGLQQGQEPGHIIGYKKAGMVRSEGDFPKGYIDISGSYAAVYADEEGLARLKAMGRDAGAVKLMPGDLYFKDRNGDNMIDAQDQFDLGNTIPHWTGGFNTRLTWKGLSLYARFDMGFDLTVYDNNLGWWLGCGQGTYSFPTQIRDTWTPENPDAKYPRYVWASVFGTDSWVRTSDLLAQSGAYLACRELSLSYQLPQNICNKFHSQGLSITVTGQNLGYLKKCTNPLPDNRTYSNGNTSGHGGTYNLPRTILFGLNVTF